MSLVKICGLSRPADIRAANEARPDFVGFVFAPGKRQVAPQQAETLARMLRPDIRRVGVFVDAPPAHITALHRSGVIQIAQLHGSEGSREVEQLQSRGVPVIKAFGVETAADVQAAGACPADYLLFDRKGGGTGQAFNWELLQGFGRAFFLAGGLSAHNLHRALALHPYCVDVSSGVEENGRKSKEKILAFVHAARNRNA